MWLCVEVVCLLLTHHDCLDGLEHCTSRLPSPTKSICQNCIQLQHEGAPPGAYGLGRLTAALKGIPHPWRTGDHSEGFSYHNDGYCSYWCISCMNKVLPLLSLEPELVRTPIELASHALTYRTSLLYSTAIQNSVRMPLCLKVWSHGMKYLGDGVCSRLHRQC